MKIGIVGYQGSGKSTLFHWLTGVAPDPALAHKTQNAMASVPDKRVQPLVDIYHPKKITLAAIDLVDTPGLSRTHEDSAQRLSMIREAKCLVMVVAAFGGADPIADLQGFDEDLLIADLEIITRRIERLRESVKKPRPNRDEELAELAALEPLPEALEAGRSIRDMDLTADQEKAIRSFQLFSQKPRLVIVNIADDEQNAEKLLEQISAEWSPTAISIGLQVELMQMDQAERKEFCDEMGVEAVEPGGLIRKIMDVSGQMLFFTAGEKEVRTWMIHKGGTAVEAAGNIHTDLARGFVRVETMTCDDLIRLGSEREVKAQNLMRHEPKGYVIQEGDILHILSSV